MAVSHPVAESLAGAPEFFIAHDFGRFAVAGLAAIVFAGIPLLFWGLASAARYLHVAIGRWVTVGLVGTFTGLMALQALKRTDLHQAYAVAVALACSGAAAFAYDRRPAVRLFASALVPAPIVIAAVFFASGPITRMMSLSDVQPAVSSRAGTATPVVMIVFDQLPLVSLMDERREIDRRRFPSFAAFADRATWYRNTAAAAEYTRWAVPALLTGRRPQADRLPATFDHPDNLFTLLGATHRFNVSEPLTALCPSKLCPPADADEGGVRRWPAALSDLAVLYGHIALPPAVAARLPSITQNWAGFTGDFFGERWRNRRENDRRQLVLDWIDAIEAGDGPSLHFLHVLLPHDPYIYLPSGQIGSRPGQLPGMMKDSVWSDDENLIALNYQRHLWQVQFVDRLLGLALDRLREVGLYDRSLIVVVADHGAGFRAKRPLRLAVPSTLGEIGLVPFLLKEPGATRGAIVDTPMEGIDVLPTIADALDIAIPWKPDGRPAQDARPGPGRRELFRSSASARRTFSADDYARGLEAAEIRKRESIDSDPARLGWRGDPARDLIGTPIAAVAPAGKSTIAVQIDEAEQFESVDPNGPFIPVYVSGTARRSTQSTDAPISLAIGVNGVVRATTLVARRPVEGREGFWAALIPPDAYKAGDNEVAVFEVLSTSPPMLKPTGASTPSPERAY
jgi:hypothetical protein